METVKQITDSWNERIQPERRIVSRETLDRRTANQVVQDGINLVLACDNPHMPKESIINALKGLKDV